MQREECQQNTDDNRDANAGNPSRREQDSSMEGFQKVAAARTYFLEEQARRGQRSLKELQEYDALRLQAALCTEERNEPREPGQRINR